MPENASCEVERRKRHESTPNLENYMDAFFNLTNGILVIALIGVIIFYVQYRKRQM